jgi:3-oxoacyl-[acyl-carrier protein] reductase
MRLKGKTAIVTGGASGFGEGIALRFAAEGACVVVADIDEARAVAVTEAIAEKSGKSHAAVCDVTVSGDIAHLVDETLSTFGAIDIVVNNAGMPQLNGPMLDTDEETFDRIFAVNVKSIYLMTRHTLPALRQVGGGVILNTASTAALRPRPGLVWYNASKGAVVTLTKAMAVELAPERIRVNALCPVAGTTPMLAAFMGGAVTNEMQEKFVATVPLGRLSSPRDIANAALYLASDEADFITGVCLEVDGGRCI